MSGLLMAIRESGRVGNAISAQVTDGMTKLTKLIKSKGMDYARENFYFSVLEFRSMRTDDQTIIDREQYWKRVLRTCEFGYNKT